MYGRWDGGLRGIGVSGREYNEVLALGVLNVVDCFEQKRRAEILASASSPHTFPTALSFQACLHVCIYAHVVRVCV